MGEEEWAPGQSCNMLGDRMGFGFSCFPFSGAISFVFLYSWYVRSPHYDRLGGSGRKGIWYIETPNAAAMALRDACSGIQIRDHTLPAQATGRAKMGVEVTRE